VQKVIAVKLRSLIPEQLQSVNSACKDAQCIVLIAERMTNPAITNTSSAPSSTYTRARDKHATRCASGAAVYTPACKHMLISNQPPHIIYHQNHVTEPFDYTQFN
jgi:hypothetical protein